MELNNTQSDLLNLLSNKLFNKPLQLSACPNWLEICSEASKQAVFPIAAHNNYHLMPQNTANKVKMRVDYFLRRCIRVHYNHNWINNLMQNAGIPYVVLKGSASAYYYPEPAFRSMGDVDFLVPENQFNRAKSVAEENGLVWNGANHICHATYHGASKNVEIHFNIPGVPCGQKGELVEQYLKDVFTTAQQVNVCGFNMQIPSTFHHGLILLLHTSHHMTGEGIGLRHLCDWAVFQNSLSNSEFVSLFKQKLSDLGIWKFAQILTLLSVKYLGAPEREWANNPEITNEYLYALMSDIFAGGNFGIKDNNRTLETVLISNRGKNGVGNKSVISEAANNVVGMVYLKWPKAKKYKILVPVGLAVFGTKNIFKYIFGKSRKKDFNKVVSGAIERRELYKQFNLFD